MAAIVVTGAGGYLGAETLAALRRAGHEALGIARRSGPGVIACDLLDRDAIRQTFAGIAPTVVIHCAWESPKTGAENGDGARADRSLAMLDNLLSATGETPVLYVSSMTVYGPDAPTAVRREDDAGEPASVYARAKLAGELRVAASRRRGFAARLPGLFGGLRKGGLVGNALDALERGNLPRLPSDPVLWAGMDVRDAAEMLTQLSRAVIGGFVPVNIGYADTFSISRLVDLFAEIYARPIPCGVAHPDFAFDLSRARYLGVVPPRNLRDALLRLRDER